MSADENKDSYTDIDERQNDYTHTHTHTHTHTLSLSLSLSPTRTQPDVLIKFHLSFFLFSSIIAVSFLYGGSKISGEILRFLQ